MGLVLLRKGMIHDDVSDWQSFLRGAEIYYGKIDGYFGVRTHLATMKFQEKFNLSPIDGIVGRKTWGRAISLGFNVDLLDDDDYYPEKPDFSPLIGDKAREDVFGKFAYEYTPTSSNPEKITIIDNWANNNIEKVELPALKMATNGKHDCMYFHKLAKDQLVGFFDEILRKNLHTLILSYAGSFYPRYIRGSRSTLSNHSWGTAFDINAPQNWLNTYPAKVGEHGSIMKIVPIAHKYGFYWGGHFSRKDGMHFEIAKLL